MRCPSHKNAGEKAQFFYRLYFVLEETLVKVLLRNGTMHCGYLSGFRKTDPDTNALSELCVCAHPGRHCIGFADEQGSAGVWIRISDIKTLISFIGEKKQQTKITFK